MIDENKYSWEMLDNTSLMLPEEIICYHIYKYEYLIGVGKKKESKKELAIIKKYIKTERLESEAKECLMK